MKYEEILTKEKCLSQLDITNRTLSRWKKLGLHFYEIEGRCFYSTKDLADFIEKFRKIL